MIPEKREAAIATQKDIRVVMNVCPDDIKKDMDTVRTEFRVRADTLLESIKAQLDDG